MNYSACVHQLHYSTTVTLQIAIFKVLQMHTYNSLVKELKEVSYCCTDKIDQSSQFSTGCGRGPGTHEVKVLSLSKIRQMGEGQTNV